MVKLVKFVALTAVLSCSLTPITATFWGDWGKVEHCPEGERATGFMLKTELDKGGGDNTALNAIALFCTSGKIISSTGGPWGRWGDVFVCQSGSYITSCQLRVEPPISGDDTAANNLNCKCSDGETLYGDGTSWGYWNDWSNTCQNGIVAIQTRVERPQGWGDDTALNDVQFTCSFKRK